MIDIKTLIFEPEKIENDESIYRLIHEQRELNIKIDNNEIEISGNTSGLILLASALAYLINSNKNLQHIHVDDFNFLSKNNQYEILLINTNVQDVKNIDALL